MKLSELIENLQKELHWEGDLEVVKVCDHGQWAEKVDGSEVLFTFDSTEINDETELYTYEDLDPDQQRTYDKVILL